MACGELEDAFDKVTSLLPDEWFLTGMIQRGDGWHVTCGKFQEPLAYSSSEIYPRIDTKAGTLTKALNRMIDALIEHNG